MREYSFPYREEPSRAFGRIARPVVEVSLRKQSGEWFVGFAASEQMPYLLGRLDVLEHFDIRFEKDKLRFIEREG